MSSWGPLTDERGRKSSAIDTMGNLSLLYWAANYTDDGSFRHVAEPHAEKSAQAFIRPDDSTYHAVEFDTQSGRRVRGYTFQGSGNESTWARGQVWAIYGFVNTARETGDRIYVLLAERLLSYYLMPRCHLGTSTMFLRLPDWRTLPRQPLLRRRRWSLLQFIRMPRPVVRGERVASA